MVEFSPILAKIYPHIFICLSYRKWDFFLYNYYLSRVYKSAIDFFFVDFCISQLDWIYLLVVVVFSGIFSFPTYIESYRLHVVIVGLYPIIFVRLLFVTIEIALALIFNILIGWHIFQIFVELFNRMLIYFCFCAFLLSYKIWIVKK